MSPRVLSLVETRQGGKKAYRWVYEPWDMTREKDPERRKRNADLGDGTVSVEVREEGGTARKLADAAFDPRRFEYGDDLKVRQKTLMAAATQIGRSCAAAAALGTPLKYIEAGFFRSTGGHQ